MKQSKVNMHQAEQAYTPAGFFLLRAPLLSANVFSSLLGLDSPSSAENGQGEDLLSLSYEQVKRLVASPEVERALLVASSSIAHGITSLQEGETSQRRASHAYSRFLRYLIRMSTRPTPFGLFSGVASGLLAEQTTVQLGESPLKCLRTRPNIAWLLAAIERLEQKKHLWTHLLVQVNHTAYLVGDRVIVPGADIYGKRDYQILTLRAAAPVRYVLEHARQPIAYQELRADLARAFPSAPEQHIDRLLEQLWEHHVLMSNLRPPLTCTDPLRYVIEQLEPVPAAAEMLALLEEVQRSVARVDCADRSHYCTSIHHLLTAQKQLAAQERFQPFQVDAALQLEHTSLNRQVGEAAALVAETLLSCGRAPQGFSHLQEYHRTFIDRYGVGAEMPLLELLQAGRGLDVPQSYDHPEPEIRRVSSPGANRQQLDQFLLTLAAGAIKQQDREIILTEAMREKLIALSPQAHTTLPPALSVLFQLQAESREAIDRGEWRAVPGPQVLSFGGSIIGRFFDLLDDEVLQRLQEFVRCEEALLPDAVFAELSYLPPSGHRGNIAIRPMLRKYEIVVNTAPTLPPERVLPLHDLVIGATYQRLYVRSLKLGKEVIVCQNHMLSWKTGPNICRFLLEVSRMRYTLPAPFHWGAASALPFLPRLVLKNVVLSPAQWNLDRAAIMPAGTNSEETRCFAALQQWRQTWNVTRFAYLLDADSRLLLDLEHPACVAELVTALKKKPEHEYISLQEMLPDFSQLWLRNTRQEPYLSEIIIPLLRTQSSALKDVANVQSAPVPRAATAKRALSLLERREAPGSLWTYLKLSISSRRQDELISDPLPRIVQRLCTQGLCDRWFYIRYYDPEPHVRVRFHAPDQERSKEVLTQAVAWGQELTQRGLIGRFCVDTYEREIERYGGPQAIDHLEQAFSIDSSVVSSLISAHYQGQLTLDLPVLATMSLDALIAAWGLTLEQRVLHSQHLTQKYRFAAEFRQQRSLLCELLAPWSGHTQAVQRQGEYAHNLLTQYSTALPSVAQTVSALAEQGLLTQQPAALLNSLAHMHINRLLGVSREQEALVYAFWHNALKSILLRSQADATQGEKRNEPVYSGATQL